MKKEKKKNAGFDAVQTIARYQAKDHLSWQERVGKPIRSAGIINSMSPMISDRIIPATVFG